MELLALYLFSKPLFTWACSTLIATGPNIATWIFAIVGILTTLFSMYLWIDDDPEADKIFCCGWGSACAIWVGYIFLMVISSIILAMWVPFSIVGGIIAIAFLARGIRRLQKKLDRHVDDKGAHK